MKALRMWYYQYVAYRALHGTDWAAANSSDVV